MKIVYDPVKIGNRLKQARTDKGMTLKEVSDIIKLSEATLSRYENGDVAKIKTPMIQVFSEIFEVEINWLLGISDIKKLPTKQGSNTIPLIGTIAAGFPILADQNVEGCFAIDPTIQADFCLRIKGDSMIDEGIQDGDIAFIKQQPTLENGEIGAIVIGDEATLKKFYKDDGFIVLQPANKNYPPIIIKENPVHVAGKLVAVLHIRE